MTSAASRSQRPISDVTKKRSRSGDNDQIAIVGGNKIFHNADFCQVQLFTEPNHPRSHERAAFRTLRQTAVVMLVISFVLLLAINALQAWTRRRQGALT